CVFVLSACLLLGACTTESSTESGDATPTTVDGAAGAVGNTAGITNDTIRISMISADLAQLTEQNLAPEIGDAAKTMTAIVADITANGGVAGRKIELVSHVLH